MTTEQNRVNSGNAKSSARKGLAFTREQLVELHWVHGLSLTAIGRIHGVSASAIKYWMNKFGVTPKARLQEVLFVPTPALSYVLGVLHGDGFLYVHPTTSRHEIVLTVTDKPFAESFNYALHALGLRANTIPVKAGLPNHKPLWKTYSCSKVFHERWNSLGKEERLDWGFRYPRDFVRGVYESEGCLKRHRQNLELAIYSTNQPMQRRIVLALESQGLHPKVFERDLESGKLFTYVQLFRNLEVRKFLAWCMPCIKYAPRRRQANREPSLGSDAQEGVETTKDAQPGIE